MDLNDRIARYLMQIPPAVEGQNGSGVTFYVACQLVNGFGLSEDQAVHWLTLYSEKCQPPWSAKEIVHKVRSAMRAAHSKPCGHLIGGNGHFSPSDLRIPNPRPEARPKVDPVQMIERWLRGFRCGEHELYEASPVKPSENLEDDGPLLISHLFEPGEIVNFVTDYKPYTRKSDGAVKANPSGYGESVERDELILRWSFGMPQSEAGGWMRMNPVDGQGVDDANVTSYRHALLEWDGLPLDLQMSFLSRLPLPISAILTSGGRSVHAWVRLDAKDRDDYETTFDQMRDILLDFGVDRKNRNPSRLSRMVGVRRVIGAESDGRQRVLYLNPNPTMRSIL